MKAIVEASVVLMALVAASGCGGSTFSAGSAGSGASGGQPGAGGASGGQPGAGGAPATGGSGGQPGTGGVGASGGSAGQPGSGGAGGTACGPQSRACTSPTDCALGISLDHQGCLCGIPALDDFTAVNNGYLTECTGPGSMCDCMSGTNPNLGATCTKGTCEGFDVSQVDALSACTSDSDCTLRAGIGCCQACGGSTADLVAIRVDASGTLAQMLCPPGGVNCPACGGGSPSGVSAACVAGHCQVVTQ
jgi:hypothetical protein